MLSPRPVELTTRDAVRIAALHWDTGLRDLGCVVAHGFTGSSRTVEVQAICRTLGGQGYGVLAPDLRGHGASGGRSTAGAQEVHDVAAAVQWLRERGYARVAVLGWSMGGAAVLRYAGLGAVSERASEPWVSASPAARFPAAGSELASEPWVSASPAARFPAAVSERASEPWVSASPAARFPAAVSELASEPWVSASPAVRFPAAAAEAVVGVSSPGRWFERGTRPMRIVHWLCETRSGRVALRLARGTRMAVDSWADVPEAPFEVVGRIAPTPLLIVHGDADHYFPLEHAELLRASAPSAEVWIEPGMGHAEAATGTALVQRIGQWLAAAVRADVTAVTPGEVCDDGRRD